MPYYYGPVVGVELYKNDVVVKRRGVRTIPPDAIRGKVKEFSKASRQRLAFVASNTSVPFRTMVTLTYPADWPHDGKRVKQDLRRFLSWMQRVSLKCDYLWFLEFQKRGAPHVHILTDYPLPRKRQELKSYRLHLAHKWYAICETGDRKHLLAGTSVETLRSAEGGARYAVKYAQKMRQKTVPEGYQDCGRFWGHTRAVKPEPQQVLRCTEDDVRGALEGWKYEPPVEQPVWKVLYNQAEWFREYVKGTIDKHPDVAYTAAEQQSNGGLLAAPPKGLHKETGDNGNLSASDS
jgi:hypothetical protein